MGMGIMRVGRGVPGAIRYHISIQDTIIGMWASSIIRRRLAIIGHLGQLITLLAIT